MEHKHFVLVHNAFHGAWIWYKLKPLLEASGHRVTAMDLAASGRDPRPIQAIRSFDEYSEPLMETMRSIPEGEKVILVGLSLGGISAAFAAERFPTKVAVLAFVNAFMPDTENSPSFVVDKFMEMFPLEWKDCEISSHESSDGRMTLVKMGPEFMKTNLYQECPVEDYELAKMLQRQGSFFQEDLKRHEKLSRERYGSVRRVLIMGAQDRATPVEFMKWETDNLGVERVLTIEGGDHMVMLSKPKELLHSLLEIAAGHS